MDYSEKTNNIVIVGAGLCGLSAAMALAEDGIKPIVVEKTGRVGGLARSMEFDGQFFDIGIHTFYKPIHPVVIHLLEIAGKEWIERNIDYAINIGPRKISPVPRLSNFIKYPLQLKLDLLKTLGRGLREFDTLENRLKSLYGEWLYDRFFEDYMAKKLPGYTGKDIHGDWWGLGDLRDELNRFTEGDRVASGNFRDRIGSGLRRSRSFLFGKGDRLIYTNRGIGGISEGLETAVLDAGAEIRFNTTVADMRFESRSLREVVLSDGNHIQARNIIWTGMLPDLLSLLGLSWPERLPYVSTALAMIAMEKGRSKPRKYLFEYCADTDVIFQRYYGNDFYFGTSDKFGICCEIAFNDDSSLPDDSEIIARAITGLKDLGEIGDDKVIAARVIREERSHPIFLTDYRTTLAELFGRIFDFDGIFLVGRSGAFNNLGMPSAILTGWKIGKHCASRVLGIKTDHRA